MQNNLSKHIFKLLFFSVIGILILSGCGSKYYFEPKEDTIKGKVSYAGGIPADIKSIVRNGATLRNGQFITKNGEIPNIHLKKDAQYLNENEEYYIAQLGKSLILINKANKQETPIALESIPISATINNNLIAIIFDTNTIAIYDLEQMKIVYHQENTPAPANNTLIASPYFLTDIVVIPTLDGKLIIVDKTSMRLVRNIVVNGDNFFNNVIFLEAIGNRMVAATPKRIISVSPNVINTFDANVKDILFFEDRIFIFSNEGEIILTDKDLNETRRQKFPFAHFSAANHGRDIVVLETQGYMILVDDDLQTSTIKKLPDEISTPTFSASDKIFIKNKFLNIQ
ncbi:hypothetical protein [Helicobacter winghamensis]|uniref:Lipoprotein n=1 Tax=Helicobacter winghamensis TaxID=157268 RepID=A0A2N3PIV1_9HELI|nr:hypothetical protein [Helicobacter winghamensis]PKT76482.1 hypothetical protein BCM32_03585 [Helicobacter winghamensis]PKT80862.1 hypothetical protein BCM31_02570 [Helicobacter winghamensis]PKT81277.1 hypothetical protein BCM33_05175 [Helicobacter winghamensis]